jgi:hypothetical protein
MRLLREETTMEPYIEFEIWVRAIANEQAKYFVDVTDSPAGSESAEMHLDPSDPEVKPLLDLVQADNADEDARRNFGMLLFNHLFTGDVKRVWYQSLGRIDATSGQRMRLRLLIVPPEIAELPWELLYDNDFLATSDNILVSRFLPVPAPAVFVTAKKLKVLVIVQEPEQMPILPEVKQGLIESLKRLGDNFAPPKILDNPTYEEINNELSNGYQIIHFLGHGAHDKLVLVKDQDIDIKDARTFAALFNGRHSARLLVLNVCGSGPTLTYGLFSGIGPVLVRKRIPAVIAMQYDKVLQQTAKTFNDSFYKALAHSEPVDLAVNSARRLLQSHDLATRDWSTPVLYMGTRTGRVLDLVENEQDVAARQMELAAERSRIRGAYQLVAQNVSQLADLVRRFKHLSELSEQTRRLQEEIQECLREVVADPVALRQRWAHIQLDQFQELRASIEADAELKAQQWWKDALRQPKLIKDNLDGALPNLGTMKQSGDRLARELSGGAAELEQLAKAALDELQRNAEQINAQFVLNQTGAETGVRE